MYIIKNALKCIGRSKGRNILIGVIVFVIALSSCIGLSIRQAAESAKEETLKNLKITATISFDRSSMMKEFGSNGSSGGFDREQFKEKMENMSSLTLEDYQKYAAADSVEDFYYTLTTSVNGTDDFSSVTTETEDENSNGSSQNSNVPSYSAGMGNKGMGGFGKGGIGGGMQGDFTLTGYSNETAMTEITNGTISINQGTVFTESTENLECIISDELAEFNSLSVGDKVKISNPNDEDETYTLKIVGIFTNSSSNETGTGFMSMTASDPANKIYLSYNALSKILAASEKNATTETDEETDKTYSTKLNGQLNGTYVFADVDSYEKFVTDVENMGLDDSYTVTSQDIEAYENSMTPLNTLSKLAGYFLIVILCIGAVILIVLNIFSVRERKYEIGVLTAMGMKKGRVALQFITEIFVITIIAVVIGAGVGAVSSVPVTNALLENQVASQNDQADRIEQGFGRGEKTAQIPDSAENESVSPLDSLMGKNNANAYVTEISSAMNFTVVLQMLGIGVLLTVISGAVSMLFIMRYEPLKILANRD